MSAVLWPFGNLRPLSYDVIVVDPPWDFELYSPSGYRKGAAGQYSLMSTDAIRDLPIGRLAQRDALVPLWATAPMLPQALDVMRCWGVTYRTHLIWRKVTKNGRVRYGTGYRARSCHELVLLGTIGNPKHTAFPSIFDGLAREHSRKPDEFFALVERHTQSMARVELFSRQSRPGWETWGNEATKFDAPAPVQQVAA